MGSLAVHGQTGGCSASFGDLAKRNGQKIYDTEVTFQHTRRVIDDDDGKTSGRKDKLRGHIGVKTSALSEGWTIGPPADNEYAVEPVGVDTMIPSDYEGGRCQSTTMETKKVRTTASVRC